MKNCIVPVFFCLLVFVYISSDVLAVPAYPYKVTVQTDNGKFACIYIRGDEHYKYAITEDGYTLLSDSTGWWYANLTNDGGITKSPYKLISIEDESIELMEFKALCPKRIMPKRVEQTRPNRTQDNYRASSNSPIVGERHALVILMQYKDLAFQKSREDFEALFNTLDYQEGGATGSVRNYYRFASQSQLDYVSDVYGPYTAKNNMRYYGGNSTSGGSDSNPLELCIEAIKSLPEDVDFSLYDNDGDGIVDNVHIIYAGYGEEAGASSDAIWAHEFPHRISLKNEVGYSFSGYSCSPELRDNRGSNITNIGVICHELGHALGAMDYYDTNYGTGGEYEGTGQWDIMASGSWNDNGKTPPNFNPYVRSTVFGWNNQVILSANQHLSMPRMEVDNSERTLIYRVETGKEGDYFLLENRQKYSFDAALPGAGLMIYHVHPNIDRYNSTNTINATSPQGFYPVCASYSEPSKKKYGKINSAECPFPGSKNVRAFTPTTSPAAVAWNGSAAKVSISYITMNTSDGSISFTTGNENIDEPDTPDLPIEKDLVYQESFETNISDRMGINSAAGKEVWRTYAKGNYVMNADLIPEASDGEKILMLYAGKGSQMNESEAVSSDLRVEAGANYTLSFDIYCMSNSVTVPSFNIFVEDEYGEYNIYSLNEVTTQWNKIDLPLTFASNMFRYKLYGRVYTGGIFIDNIRLYKEQEISSIDDISDTTNQTMELCSLDGRHIGKNIRNVGCLPSGIYILRQGKLTRKIIIR
ncbi:MAG: M6 family metalloprotease domain-containing protein [Prevotella sp.]|nr:M6 family metalloprotease domain-containing protein [Prevotella sp.]